MHPCEDKLDASIELHARIAGLLTIVSLLFVRQVTSEVAHSLWILAPLIALLGVPHGGTDLGLLRQSSPSQLGTLLAGAAYLTASAAIVFAWFLAPTTCLVAFLALSVWHFGEGDARLRPAGLQNGETVLRGVIPVVAPFARVHDAQVVTALDALLPSSDADYIRTFLESAFPVVIAVPALSTAALAYVALRAKRPGVAIEVALLLGSALLLPALVSFTVYFCVWHAARHTIWLAARDGRSLRATFLSGLAMSAGAIVLAAAAIRWIPSDAEATERVLRAVFIGLAALTVPHAFLVWRAVEAAPRGLRQGSANAELHGV